MFCSGLVCFVSTPNHSVVTKYPHLTEAAVTAAQGLQNKVGQQGQQRYVASTFLFLGSVVSWHNEPSLWFGATRFIRNLLVTVTVCLYFGTRTMYLQGRKVSCRTEGPTFSARHDHTLCANNVTDSQRLPVRVSLVRNKQGHKPPEGKHVVLF